MNAHRGPLPGLLALALVFGLASSASASESDNLTPKAFPKWTNLVPNETWTKVATTLPIPHANGQGFLVTARGPCLLVDTNGDGKVETKVQGAFGFVKLKAKDAAGEEIVYGVRFRHSSNTWECSVSGAMCGRLKGVPVKVIDRNMNGVYDEYGVDAIIVGRGKAASFLSKVVNLRGTLYDFSISKNGRSVELTEYKGETGTIDLRSRFSSRGKLVSAVISNETGDVSFNVARGSLEVPVGKYRITGGLAKRAGESAKIGGGRMQPIAVPAGEKLVLDWGAPVTADFRFEVTGEQIKVRPDVHFYGKAGEEYHDWVPDAKSPKLLVFDKQTEKVVASGRFGGC